jgi:hypothetical protein
MLLKSYYDYVYGDPVRAKTSSNLLESLTLQLFFYNGNLEDAWIQNQDKLMKINDIEPQLLGVETKKIFISIINK